MLALNQIKPAVLSVAILLGFAAHCTQARAAETVIVAGGCFWCVEQDFERVPGVISAVSGFAGGKVADPTYKQVVRGGTGHREVVQITFDPEKLSHAQLFSMFLRSVDPTDAGGQFCDRGQSYETAIFAKPGTERDAAEASKSAIEASGVLSDPIVTPILDAATFWDAEDYHQDYYLKNPLRYNYYRRACGRDNRIKEVWAKELASN